MKEVLIKNMFLLETLLCMRLGKSSVRLESKVLEHLLHALDSRHISGWYHPAMRIQAKVDVVEGNNEALREQLRSLR